MSKKTRVNVELEGVGKIKCPMCSNEIFINTRTVLDKGGLSIFGDEADTLICDDCNFILFFHRYDQDISYLEEIDYKARKQLNIIPIKK